MLHYHKLTTHNHSKQHSKRSQFFKTAFFWKLNIKKMIGQLLLDVIEPKQHFCIFCVFHSRKMVDIYQMLFDLPKLFISLFFFMFSAVEVSS